MKKLSEMSNSEISEILREFENNSFNVSFVHSYTNNNPDMYWFKFPEALLAVLMEVKNRWMNEQNK